MRPQLYRVQETGTIDGDPPRQATEPPKPSYRPSHDRVFLGAFNKAIADELQSRLKSNTDWRNLNDQQEAVLNWALLGQGSCNTISRAGTGKTTLALELAKRVGDPRWTEA